MGSLGRIPTLQGWLHVRHFAERELPSGLTALKPLTVRPRGHRSDCAALGRLLPATLGWFQSHNFHTRPFSRVPASLVRTSSGPPTSTHQPCIAMSCTWLDRCTTPPQIQDHGRLVRALLASQSSHREAIREFICEMCSDGVRVVCASCVGCVPTPMPDPSASLIWVWRPL
jgi:hypothetical protein